MEQPKGHRTIFLLNFLKPFPAHISFSDSDLVRKTFRNFRGDLKQYRSTVYEMQI